MKRFEIWLAELPRMADSHVQSGTRPIIIVSNDMANQFSPVITVVPLTSNLHKPHLPTHVFLSGQGLNRNSLALCDQVMPLDKSKLKKRIGFIYKSFDRLAIEHAMSVQLNLAA